MSYAEDMPSQVKTARPTLIERVTSLETDRKDMSKQIHELVERLDVAEGTIKRLTHEVGHDLPHIA